MGLMPLEYKDCITDSPYFRQKLHSHEKELDRTSQAIKQLTKEVKDLISAAKELSKAHRRLSHSLSIFKFECIGNSQTDDEIVIGSSLKEFAKIVDMVEDERDRMLDRSYDQIISPLENFRKEAIGGAKEGRKKFEKQTLKFYQNQEKYLNLSTKKDDLTLKEADASVEMEQRFFAQASLEYVFLLQEVQERKKFEFVETLLSYMYSWLTFYHQGHEVYTDCSPYLRDLQVRLQRTRENFMSTRQEAVQLKNKMLEKNSDPGSMDKMYTRQGYLFLMEKKAFGTTWTKHYCQYQKESRIFTMIPYNQIQQKITSTETLMLKTCVRRMSETIDKRFCFDLTAQDKDKVGLVYTLQALCEEDRKLWMDAMDGKEPVSYSLYAQPLPNTRPSGQQEQTDLDAAGLSFITRAINALETRGLEDQGLYRLVGVSSKVTKLLSIGLDPTKCSKLSLDDPSEWETKTITSAVKQFFRNLPVPLMTFALHSDFIAAAKREKSSHRIAAIQELIHKLPHDNKVVLRELVFHLCKVAGKSDKNLMTVSNLGVCFGPTLLRPEEETVAAIMDIKFCNIVVEILIEHYDKIFCEPPDLPCLMDGMNLSHPSSSSSSSPKSSPPPPQPSGGSKHSQPVLQTVVTSFTTSEPQTVHFGGGSTTASSAMQRADGSSNLKPGQHYHGSYSAGVSQLWGHSNSSSSLNSAGLTPGLTSHSSLSSLTTAAAAAQQQQHASNSQQHSRNSNRQQPSSISTSNALSNSINNIYSATALLSGSSTALSSTALSNGGAVVSTSSAASRVSGMASAVAAAVAPLSFANPLIGNNIGGGAPTVDVGGGVVSTSSSSESLCSRSSRGEHITALPPPSSHHHSSSHHHHHHPPPPSYHHHQRQQQQQQHSSSSSNSSPPQSRPRLGAAYPPTYRQHMETNSLSGSGSIPGGGSSALASLPPSLNNNSLPSSSSSSSSTSSAVKTSSNGTSPLTGRVVRTLYACVGENDSELSFEPNVYLTNVRVSREPGWLEGTLHGKTGLVPENYVEDVDEKSMPPHLLHSNSITAAPHRNTEV